MKQLHLITFLILSLSTSLAAQGKQQLKWQQTIDGLEKSEFIQSFTKAKARIEQQMSDFHSHKDSLKKEDVEAVKKGYETSAANFDHLLDDLKSDFLNKETRKIMTQSPDRFTKYYNAELAEAVRTYNNVCLSKADALTNTTQGAFGMAEITFIIDLGKQVYALFKQHQENVAKISNEFFEERFIRKLRLRKWENY